MQTRRQFLRRFVSLTLVPVVAPEALVDAVSEVAAAAPTGLINLAEYGAFPDFLFDSLKYSDVPLMWGSESYSFKPAQLSMQGYIGAIEGLNRKQAVAEEHFRLILEQCEGVFPKIRADFVSMKGRVQPEWNEMVELFEKSESLPELISNCRTLHATRHAEATEMVRQFGEELIRTGKIKHLSPDEILPANAKLSRPTSVYRDDKYLTEYFKKIEIPAFYKRIFKPTRYDLEIPRNNNESLIKWKARTEQVKADLVDFFTAEALERVVVHSAGKILIMPNYASKNFWISGEKVGGLISVLVEFLERKCAENQTILQPASQARG